jgi:prepilin-type N-terminal cleavage/methylation domain-containing protein
MKTDMKNKGFTLIELMVVITIVGILLAIGTINFAQWSRKANMEAQVKQMYTDALSAKVDAMHRKVQINMNIYVNTDSYDTRDSAGTVLLPLKTVRFPVTTSAGAGNNLTLSFDLNGLKTAPNTTQTICLQDNDSALTYDSIIIDAVKVNLAKRNPGGACAPANCTIK